MKMKTALVVWLTVCTLCCAISAVSRQSLRPKWCLDGTIGFPCHLNTCSRPGYFCVSNLCCRLQIPLCSNGLPGPRCFHFRGRSPCFPGLACIDGHCCPVCPAGMREGGACNRNFGNARCQFGYQCINNLCCSSRQRTCPRRSSMNMPCVFQKIRRPPLCSTDNDCSNGMLCCEVGCGHRMCVRGVYTG